MRSNDPVLSKRTSCIVLVVILVAIGVAAWLLWPTLKHPKAEGPSDAPTAVPAALVPSGTRTGARSVTVSYLATGSSGETLSYGQRIADWYTKKLGGSVTGTSTYGPERISFRGYDGKYSGVIDIGSETVTMPQGTPRATVLITLEDPHGSLTGVPGDFPILSPDMSRDKVPQANQEYERPQLSPGLIQSTVDTYKKVLGSSVTGVNNVAGYVRIGFDGYEHLRGAVYVASPGVVLNLSKSGGEASHHLESMCTSSGCR